MFVLISFFILACGIYGLIFLNKKLSYARQELQMQLRFVEAELIDLHATKRVLEKEIETKNSELSKTVKIYETARDICSSLDEDKLISRFKEDLNKFIEHAECEFFPEDGFDPSCFPNGSIFPLSVQERCLGYLVVQGTTVQSSPYVGILVGNFALGLKRARLYKMVQDLATTDSLTGLYTRRYALERLKEEFLRSEAHKLNLSFIMIDVDDFKQCNDKSGHLVGDIVLSEIALKIKENIREVDMLARFGGEEFMVFAPNTSKESASIIAERIRKGVEAEPIRAYDEKVKATVSVGLATYPEDAKDSQGLIGKAD